MACRELQRLPVRGSSSKARPAAGPPVIGGRRPEIAPERGEPITGHDADSFIVSARA